MNYFDELPNEIISKILNYVDPSDLCRISEISIRFNFIAKRKLADETYHTFENKSWLATFYVSQALGSVDMESLFKQMNPGLDATHFSFQDYANKIIPELVSTATDIFTFEELRYLTINNCSKVGKSVLKKLPLFMKQFQETILENQMVYQLVRDRIVRDEI